MENENYMWYDVQSTLPDSFELHPVKFRHILYVVVFKDGHVRYSLHPASEMYQNRFDGPKRVPNQFCKAAGKITEALTVAGFDLSKPGGVAIDVGASPGGWTHQLAQSMDIVIAIDPADLHPTVRTLENVHHVRKKSQDAGPDIESLCHGKPVDIVCCDANRGPRQLMEMLAPSFAFLKKGGLAIMTLKLQGKGLQKREEKSSSIADEIFKDSGFGNFRHFFLLANTRNETTVVAQKLK